MESPRRRDWLVTTAAATAGVGVLLALYPFIAALQPPEDVRARRTTFNVKDLDNTDRAIVNVANAPVILFRRSATDLIALRDAHHEAQLRDAASEHAVQPAWAKNWHRSLRPDIMICVGQCTRDNCIVMRERGLGLLCPCCGGRYDLAGRALAASPAPRNLRVPPHRFVDETTIEFVDGDFSLRPSPADPA